MTKNALLPVMRELAVEACVCVCVCVCNASGFELKAFRKGHATELFDANAVTDAFFMWNGARPRV